jgi:phospholipase C
MMENRSFNTLLGYMSLEEFGKRDVDGLKDDPAWNAKIASVYKGSAYLPWHSNDPFSLLPSDPPHERAPIALQMGTPANGVFPMNGFVSNFATVCPVNPGDRPPVMSYFTPAEAPITAFLADNFAVCDRWFCSLPAGTQANRLVQWVAHPRSIPIPFRFPTKTSSTTGWTRGTFRGGFIMKDCRFSL